MAGPFKLKSGNTTPFKMMGSSPAKHTKGKAGSVEDLKHKKDVKHDDAGKHMVEGVATGAGGAMTKPTFTKEQLKRLGTKRENN